MTRALLLINPVSGRRPVGEGGGKALQERLSRIGVDCEVVYTRNESRPVPRLDLSDKDLLIVYGGDGTVHQALGQAVEADCPMALIPAGTANVLVIETGIPRDLEGALQVIEGGCRRTIHLGRADGCFFHLMAGIGLDGYVIERVAPRLKRWFGALAYWIAGFQSLWSYPLPEFELSLDGRTHRATFAVVSNASNYGGRLIMAPRASLFEQCLDVCLFTSRRRGRFLTYLWGALSGRHIRYPDVVYRKVQRVEVSGDGSIPIQMDGELVGQVPMSFTIAPAALDLLVPETGRRSRPD